eukprot:TRINITY_DN11014_c0_g1_i4.p1 TRINITY_DN11014_c0_g1~~TRINITY_DN11014_c0_g1_i4.p1  ORF type:complete len:924 (+),score=181.28 TRINITY_DN11014_c0_g1_i4:175-2946(+)
MNANTEEHAPELTSPEAVRYRGQKLYAQHDFEPTNQDEVQLFEGDEVEVICTPPGGWIQVKNKTLGDRIGWVPQSHLTPLDTSANRMKSLDKRRASDPGQLIAEYNSQRGSSQRDSGSKPLKVVSLATAGHNYQPANEDELELRPGSLVYVMEKPEGGWWRGYREVGPSQRLSGWFPASHVTMNSEQAASSLSKIYETPVAVGRPRSRTPSPTNVPVPMRGRKASVTGMMQDKRSEINAEIQKELRVREGAENMLKAYRQQSKKQRKKNGEKERDIAVTLSFANSNLQRLRQDLQALNSKVQASVRTSISLATSSQPPDAGVLDTLAPVTTMTLLALGLKETKPAILAETIGYRLKKHFHETLDRFQPALERLAQLRQVIELHQRTDDSLNQHFEYYRRLQHVKDRFAIKGSVSRKLSFEWFDCFNGQPHDSTDVEFERACVLFNAGALSMQMAAGCNTTSHKELDKARDRFETAAGVFQFLADHMSYPACADLSPLTLQMLIWLNLAQAQECMLLAYLQRRTQREPTGRVPPGEAAAIAEFYRKTVQLMSSDLLSKYLPPQWLHLVQAKAWLYEGLSDFYTAEEQLQDVVPGTLNQDSASWAALARYLRAEDLYKRAIRLQNQRLAQEHGLQQRLEDRLIQVREVLADHNQEAIFKRVGSIAELRDMLPTKSKPALICQPNYKALAIDNVSSDPFAPLGPVSVFNVASQFEAQRPITFRLQLSQMSWQLASYGETGPVVIKQVYSNGLAQAHGFRSGDILLAVNKTSARWKDFSDIEPVLKGFDGKTVTLRVQQVPTIRSDTLDKSVELFSDDAQTITSTSPRSLSRDSSNISLQVVLHTGNAAEGGSHRPPLARSLSTVSDASSSSRPRLLSTTSGASKLIAASQTPSEGGKFARMASSPLFGADLGVNLFRNPMYDGLDD